MTATGDTRLHARLGVPVGPRLAALASLLVLLGGLGTGLARTLVHQCAHLDGPLATLGVRLTLLQDVADCPDGTLAMLPTPTQGAVLAIGLAIPALAAHAVLGALGAALAAVLLRTARTARGLLAAVVHTLPEPGPTGAAPVARPVLVRPVAHALPAVLARALHPHRGPPVALA